eukprot:gene3966-17479_t
MALRERGLPRHHAATGQFPADVLRENVCASLQARSKKGRHGLCAELTLEYASSMVGCGMVRHQWREILNIGNECGWVYGSAMPYPQQLRWVE